MRVALAYGQQGLVVDLPVDDCTVIEPTFVPGLPDPEAALEAALAAPLGTAPLRTVPPSARVTIVFSDITRPTPNHQIIPAILRALAHLPPERITLLNATGLHRPNTPAELARMLGAEVVRRYRVLNHDAHADRDLVYVGRTPAGNAVWLNRHYVEADVRIVTGFIEPHFFAGFSGGYKGVLPGVAGAATIMFNHSAPLIAHPSATWAVTDGNPIHEDQRAGARLAPPTFLVNVTLNKHKEITGVYAGALEEAYPQGVAAVRATALRSVQAPFDIVITTNSGYPLDLNLYQAVKGMAAAAQIVRPGGAIILAAECREGIGHRHYRDLLAARPTPADLLSLIHQPGFQAYDQWQAQIQAQILLRARVFVYSDYLAPDDLRAVHLEPCPDIAATVGALLAEYGPGARVAVLPQGPQTVPYLAGSAAPTVTVGGDG